MVSVKPQHASPPAAESTSDFSGSLSGDSSGDSSGNSSGNSSGDPGSGPLHALQAALETDMRAVDALILERMRSDVALIPQLAGYLIASGGKRIRPLLTLAAASLYGGQMSRAHLLAASVEFIHTATLLHDDVVDDSDQRRGQPAANTVFGNEASVLVGDFLFSRAFQLMVEDGSLETLRILSGAAAVIAEGEVLQLSTQNNLNSSMDDYLAVIDGKTAALFAAACEVGPVIAGRTGEAQHMRAFGRNLGMAFQIIDDVLDYSAAQERLGKKVGDDFREGKITAPVLFALDKAGSAEMKFWERTLKDKDQRPEDLARAQNYISQSAGDKESFALAQSYAAKAGTALANAPDTPLRALLKALLIFTVERAY